MEKICLKKEKYKSHTCEIKLVFILYQTDCEINSICIQKKKFYYAIQKYFVSFEKSLIKFFIII